MKGTQTRGTLFPAESDYLLAIRLPSHEDVNLMEASGFASLLQMLITIHGRLPAKALGKNLEETFLFLNLFIYSSSDACLFLFYYYF